MHEDRDKMISDQVQKSYMSVKSNVIYGSDKKISVLKDIWQMFEELQKVLKCYFWQISI